MSDINPRFEVISALWTLATMRRLANERDDWAGKTGEDCLLEYLNGPAWDEAERVLGLAGKPVDGAPEPRIRVGTKVSDNDPWYQGARIMVVVAIGFEDVGLHDPRSGRTTRIALRRIHTDGKPRRSGWSVVG